MSLMRCPKQNDMSEKQPHFTFFLIVFLFTLFNSCIAQEVHNDAKKDTLTDSLITVKAITENVLLITFGADAITAINTSKGIVVIDAGISTGLTVLYKKHIEVRYPDCKFAYVINTHAHHDHCRGNSVFEGACIVGHENGLLEIENQFKNSEKIAQYLKKIADEFEMKLKEFIPYSAEWLENYTQKIRYEYAFNDALNKVPVTPTDLVFADSLTIAMGNVTFEMVYFGKCHSESDILIFSPELNILFSGDLFFRYGRISQNNNMMDKERWTNALDWLKIRKPYICTIIGGHGQLLGIEDLEAFMKNVRELL